jgi:hypothetical protein
MLQAHDPLGKIQKNFYQNPWIFAKLAGVQSQILAFSGGYKRSFHHFKAASFLFYKMNNIDSD